MTNQAGQVFTLARARYQLLAEAPAGGRAGTPRRASTVYASLVVPLLVAGRSLGSMTFGSTTGERRYDDADLLLAEELGRRVASVIEADRVATRERQLHAGTVALAAAAVSTAVATALGATGIAVYVVGPDDPHLHLIHTVGYPPEVARSFARIAADADLAAAAAARTRAAVWLGDQQAWLDRYPNMAVAGAAEEAHALTAPPLIIGDQRCVSPIGDSSTPS